MIVRNEEEKLPRCLTSIKHVVDEIIVVDTGSTDRTVKIAQLFGAKVYHHPWQNDFSLHRNQSLNYATGHWCLVIDADEWLDGDPKTLHALDFSLKNAPGSLNALSLETTDERQGRVVMSFNSLRLFRKGKVQYSGRVHNQPIVEGGNKAAVVPNVILHHDGYDLTPDQMKAKRKRTDSLLKKRLEDDPNDTDAMFYLAQSAGMAGEHEAVIKWVELYKEKSGGLIQNKGLYFAAACAYMNLAKFEQAVEWVTVGIKAIPNSPDLALCLSDLGQASGDVLMALRGAELYVSIYRAVNDKGRAVLGDQFVFNLGLPQYAACLTRCGQIRGQQAKNMLDEARFHARALGDKNLIQAIEATEGVLSNAA
jgi:tetratricopeptide (TPR) repeat protein